LLKVAARDLDAATNNLGGAPDWAYRMAYNAILQVSRALMLSQGYRAPEEVTNMPPFPHRYLNHFPFPATNTGLRTVRDSWVEFVKEALGEAYENQTHLFDQMRRKRHRVIYETAGLVSRNEAEQVVNFSKGFVIQMTAMIPKQMGPGI
jgi:uncharacterized protein (UPF0332 family)